MVYDFIDGVKLSAYLWSKELKSLIRETLDQSLCGMFRGPKFNLKKKNGDDRIYGYIVNRPQIMSRTERDDIITHVTNGSAVFKYKSI